MSLTWDITAVKDSKEICWIPCKEKGKEDKFELGVVTHTLIWSTMLIGMNSITEKNSKEFHKRLTEFEVIHGAGMILEKGEARQPTIEEIKSHVGMKTNATIMDSRKWGNNLKRLVKEKAANIIKGHPNP
jgi:hypothetical protein